MNINKIYNERFSSLDKIRETYTKFRMRSGRGNNFPLVFEIKGVLASISSGGIIVLLIDRYTGWLTPIWVLVVLWVINKITDYLFGKLDEKFLKFWQAENKYGYEVNPYFEENFKKINEKLDKLK